MRHESHDLDVPGEGDDRGRCLPVRLHRGNRELLPIRGRTGAEREVPAFRGCLRKGESDLHVILHRLPVWGVVHVDGDVGAGGNQLRSVELSKVSGHTARLIALFETVAAGQNAEWRVQKIRRELRPSGPRSGLSGRATTGASTALARDLHSIVITRHLPCDRGAVLRVGMTRNVGQAHVMRDGELRRLHFDRRDPGVFREVALHDEPRPLDDAAGGHVVGGSLDDEVGLDLPSAIRPRDWRRGIARVARRRAGICPPDQHVDLCCLQRAIVENVGGATLSKPRRHLLRQHRSFDRTRPWTRGLVRLERHRRDLARTMAGLAVLLQERRHVLVERDRRSRAGLRHNDVGDHDHRRNG